MLGVKLIEELVQSVAISHLIKDGDRVSLLLLADPENGKTTVAASAKCDHVEFVSVITGRSILKAIKEKPSLEYLIFNDLSCIRALSQTASNLLIVLLNQITRGEKGSVAFAGGPPEQIEREIGIVGCLPMTIFSDHRSRWKEIGFVSRMLPFAYGYSETLIMEIKDSIDYRPAQRKNEYDKLSRRISKIKKIQIPIRIKSNHVSFVRKLADERASELGQMGIRLLKNYHTLVKAHALLFQRKIVNESDLRFLMDVDSFISLNACKQLESVSIQEFNKRLK